MLNAFKNGLLAVSVSLLGLCLMTTACKKDSSNRDARLMPPATLFRNVSDSIFVESFTDSVGIIHNQLLDSVFQEIKDGQLFAGKSRTEVLPAIAWLSANAVSKYFEGHGIYSDAEDLFERYDLNHVNYTPIAPNGSAEFMGHIIKLEQKLDDVSVGEAELISFARSEYDDSESDLSWEERMCLKIYVNVMISSFQYWTQNLGEWDKEYNDQNNINTAPTARSIRGIVKADMRDGGGGYALAGGFFSPFISVLQAYNFAVIGSAVAAVK